MINVANRNDVARKAGVSGATVSRVFNNPDSVSPQTREKVLKASEELNYHPNVIASNFVKGITRNIGVIIPHIPNVHIFSVHYFSELLSGIGEALEEKGYHLVLFFHKMVEGVENDYTRYFKGGKVDGCILLGTLRNDSALLKLQQTGYRFCLVNNYIKNSGISFVDVDNISGSYEAVKYLISLGHKDIAFLNGPFHYSNSVDRLEGYKKALEEHGISVDSKYIFEGNYGKKSGYLAVSKILNLKKLPTAVFSANDRMAAGLLQGLMERGIRVPEDVAIIGYDDSDIATLVQPQLTTVRVPFFELGKKCVYEFIKLVNGEDEGCFKTFITPKLVIRASSGAKKLFDRRG